MMDIVQRLRDVDPMAILMHEAADEIERLQAALEWYAAGKGMWDDGQRAREALNGTKAEEYDPCGYRAEG